MSSENSYARIRAFRGRQSFSPRNAIASNVRVFVVRDVSFQYAREHRLQRVVVLLRNRIEFVIVTPRAVGRRTEERRRGLRDEVVTVQVIERYARRDVRAEIEIPGAQKTERGRELRFLRVKVVGGKLLADESGVRAYRC